MCPPTLVEVEIGDSIQEKHKEEISVLSDGSAVPILTAFISH